MDDLDLSGERSQFLLDLQIKNQLDANARYREADPGPCEDCEEQPRATLRGNTRGRFCSRCMAEHEQVDQLSFI